MLGGFLMVAALLLFVMAHEAGHLIAAKATGMKATEFFAGFGPRLFSFRKGETEYGIKLIPAGGYVRIAGMNPYEEVDPADVGRTYREKQFWEKAIVVLSGVLINLLLGYLLLFAMFLAYGNLTGDLSTTVSTVSTEVDGQPAPAALAGIREGDVIVGVDRVATPTWDDVVAAISARPGETVVLDVQRAGETLSIETDLAAVATDDGGTRGFLGVSPSAVIEDVGVVESAGLAGVWTGRLLGLSGQFLWEIVTGVGELSRGFLGEEVRPELRPVSVVGLAQIGSQADVLGADNVLFLLAGINIILAFMNALPIFPLDGGHFAVAVFERVFRREVDIRKLVPVAAVVVAFFVFLGVISVYLDLSQPFRLN